MDGKELNIFWNGRRRGSGRSASRAFRFGKKGGTISKKKEGTPSLSHLSSPSEYSARRRTPAAVSSHRPHVGLARLFTGESDGGESHRSHSQIFRKKQSW